MPSLSRDLSLADIEAWMRDHGFTIGGKPDWKRLVVAAGLGATQQYVVKSRWGENPEQMDNVIELLEKLEQKKPTETGARVAALSEWLRIGRVIFQLPEVFARELEHIREVARDVEKVIEGDRARAALLSPTPTPTKPRK